MNSTLTDHSYVPGNIIGSEDKGEKVLDFLKLITSEYQKSKDRAGSKQDLQEQCRRCVYAAHSFYFAVLWYLSA